MPVCQKFTGEIIKIEFSVSVRKNWNKIFCERLWFSLPLLDFYWKFFVLINFFLAQLNKTAFYVTIRTFWERILCCKIVFSIIFRIEWKFFRIWLKFPRWGCQNWIIRVQANILRKILLLEKDAFFVNLGHWKKNSRPFFEFLSAQLSKLHSKCPKEQLKGIEIFPQTNVFFHQFGRLRHTFQPCVKKFRAGLSNLCFTCPSKEIEGIGFLRKLCFVDLVPWAKSFRHSV